MSASAHIPLVELNDSGVRCFMPGQAGHLIPASPGYALLKDKQLIVGEQARQQAWLSPQWVYNQFWQQLSLSPLAVQNHLARHNADLAYAHLLDLHKKMEHPGQVYFAVPGNFSKDQLGILLGLAKAANITVAGLVDAALLSATSSATRLSPGKYLHLDLQLHQLLVTEIIFEEKLTRGRIESFSSLGLKPMLDSLAHTIADKFIAQYRFDPLHSAKGEQQLHDNLPGLLQKIHQLGEAPLSMTSVQGNYQLSIRTEDIQCATTENLTALRKYLASQSTHQLLVSHRLATFPGFVDQLQNAITLPEDSLFQGYKIQHKRMTNADGKIGLITTLTDVKQEDSEQPLPQQPSTDKTVTQKSLNQEMLILDPRVTHLVHNGRAYPLTCALGLNPITKNLIMGEDDINIPLVQNTAASNNPPSWQLAFTPDHYSGLQPGDTLEYHGQTLMLVELQPIHAESNQAGH